MLLGSSGGRHWTHPLGLQLWVKICLRVPGGHLGGGSEADRKGASHAALGRAAQAKGALAQTWGEGARRMLTEGGWKRDWGVRGVGFLGSEAIRETWKVLARPTTAKGGSAVQGPAGDQGGTRTAVRRLSVSSHGCLCSVYGVSSCCLLGGSSTERHPARDGAQKLLKRARWLAGD